VIIEKLLRLFVIVATVGIIAALIVAISVDERKLCSRNQGIFGDADAI
jgi:hypothetical protein